MRKGFIIVGVILVAAIGAGGYAWHYYNGGAQGASDAPAVYVSTVSTITGAASGVTNRYAGVVEPQETVEVNIEGNRKVKEVNVKAGQEVSTGQLLFEYDLSSIQEDLQQAKLDLDRLKNEALSLTDQIATLEKEKKQAKKDNQLSYTIEIETNKMNLKKNEYDQKSKEAEIQKLQNASGNTEVRSEIDGVIQKIDTSKMSTEEGDILEEGYDDYSMGSSDGNSNAFITILSTGAYRVKGQVNEMEAQTLMEGTPMIVRSRVDNSQTWRGALSTVDRENAVESNNNNMFGMMDTGDSQTTSSTYPFYVELDSSEGLMLGQHVYIERDDGQEDKKDGLWLSEFYIAGLDTEDPYVWAVDDNEKLEKRSVILGNYDEVLEEYEIVDGLTLKDSIAYPQENLEEGMPTTTSEAALEDTGVPEDMGMEDLGEEMPSVEEMEGLDMSEDPEMFTDEDVVTDEEMYGEEVIMDPDEVTFDDMVPMEEFDESGETIYEEDVQVDNAEDLG